MVLYVVVTLGNGGHIKVGKTELNNLSQVVGYVKAASKFPFAYLVSQEFH